MIKKAFGTCKDKKGETLIETLVGTLIITLAMSMLAGSISISVKYLKNVKNQDKTILQEWNQVESALANYSGTVREGKIELACTTDAGIEQKTEYNAEISGNPKEELYSFWLKAQ